jgi:DNA-binding NtrC family response regulator
LSIAQHREPCYNIERLSLGNVNGRVFEIATLVNEGIPALVIFQSIRRLISAAIELAAARRERRERAALWPASEAQADQHGIFVSEKTVDILTTARKIAGANVNVLITGETGTGKELLARAIHDSSPRAGKAFLPFNCTAVPREMLDSQLFGHRRGAFTGAQEAFPGVVRAAGGGTLFLDEIGEIGLDLQPKLLRFLELGEIHPLGESHPVKVDVRVIAATNANLDQLVTDGKFREDLFYRLNVIRFRMPPLRERREEIPPLVEFFLRRYGEEFQKPQLRLAEETMEYLLLYAWPGNVRQLSNELRRLVALAEQGAVLMPEHLSAEITAGRRTVPASERDLAPAEVVVRLDQPLAAAIEHIERAMLQYALKSSGGRVESAARALGLSRKGLYLKRHRLGVEAAESN